MPIRSQYDPVWKSEVVVREVLTVWELGLEEVVISPRHFGNCLGQVLPLLVVKVHESSLVVLGDDHDLKGPGCPPRADGDKSGIFKHQALLLLRLELCIVFQHVSSSILGTVLGQVVELQRRLLGKTGRGPDLAVGVRVGTAHGGALVFKDLHVAVLGIWLGDIRSRGGRQRGRLEVLGKRGLRIKVDRVDARPGVDYGQDLARVEVGESDIVRGRESEDVALAGDGLSTEERSQTMVLGGWRRVFCLLFLDGAVVVDEDERLLVFWIRIALGSLITGTEVALAGPWSACRSPTKSNSL